MMTIEDFISGGMRRSERGYSYFLPNSVNDTWQWVSPLITEASTKATDALARLDALSDFVPDMHTFIRLHTAAEATASNRIEGTRTEVSEAMTDDPVLIDEERRDDWQEVKNT